jgi:ubiquinone/menaquinone biosynthesis C-methylase UbiE
MPTPVQLELALAGVALARNWLVGDRETVEMIEAEIRRLAATSANGWPDVPERTVAEGYPEWAPGYDQPDNPIIRLEESVVPALLAESPPGRALDAACGTGRHTARLVELGHDVIGVDETQAMLSLARTRVPEAEFQVGSLTALPLEDEEADLAICALALTHVAELGPAVSELRRVVRPGGRVVVSDVHPTFVALGSQGAYRVDDERAGFVRNHQHWPGAYLAAFAAARLDLRASHDVVYRREEVDVWVDRLDLAPDVAYEALVGLPAVVVWDLARA